MRALNGMVILASTAALLAHCSCAETGPTESVRSASVPFTLDHNRMIVEVEFERPDGSLRKATAWVDTGNQFLIVAKELATDLGLDVTVLDGAESPRPQETPSPSPAIFLGAYPLTVDGVAVQVSPGARVWAGVPAEANLPASVFRGLHVVFDYPEHTLTVAGAGQLLPRGNEIPCRINPETGLFQIEVGIDGDFVELGVDTGSAGTWISSNLTRTFKARHPDWPSSTGAVGSANFFGFEFEASGTLMNLPEIRFGVLKAARIAVLGLDQRLFDWYSMKSAGPVVGILGANVLRGFRLEVDSQNQMIYWEPGPSSASDDVDIVGLALRPEADGSYSVAGVASKNGVSTVPVIEPGDVVKQIDAFETTGISMGPVIEALRGNPGERRLLVIERNGELLDIEAEVTRFP